MEGEGFILWRNKGFFLAEMLLSLAALCIAALFLVPALTFVYERGIQLQKENSARRLLYAELLKTEAEVVLSGNVDKLIKGTSYSITYSQDQDGGGEVCVEYEAAISLEKKMLCEKVE